MRCNKPNSPVGSHQWAERREKWEISDAEMVLVGFEEGGDGLGEKERREDVRNERAVMRFGTGAEAVGRDAGSVDGDCTCLLACTSRLQVIERGIV